MSSGAFVTTHAVRQYQERVQRVPFERARVAIHSALRHPTAYLLKQDKGPCLWLGIGGQRPFIAVVICARDADRPVVVTVLPAAHEQQRGCPPNPPRWEVESLWRPIRDRRDWAEMLRFETERTDAERTRERRGA